MRIPLPLARISQCSRASPKPGHCGTKSLQGPCYYYGTKHNIALPACGRISTMPSLFQCRIFMVGANVLMFRRKLRICVSRHPKREPCSIARAEEPHNDFRKSRITRAVGKASSFGHTVRHPIPMNGTRNADPVRLVRSSYTETMATTIRAIRVQSTTLLPTANANDQANGSRSPAGSTFV